MSSASTDLEEFLAGLKGWRRDEADSEEVQNRIDSLDEILTSASPNGCGYARAVRHLQFLCRRAGRLPHSCSLSSEVVLDDHGPYSTSNFSDVYCGRIGELCVAVKALRVHADSRAKVQKAFHSEAVMWKFLQHPNLVQFLGVSTTMAVCLVSEWMPNGTISSFLVAHPDYERGTFVRQIVDGLEYMHSLGFVHGDLKAANILVTADERACLADFGLASVLHGSASVTGTSSLSGTLRWMSPELIKSSDSDGGTSTFASDVYALAMVFYEVFTGLIPFHELRNEACVLLRVLDGCRPVRPAGAIAIGLSNPIRRLIKQCWVPDPKQRLTTGSIANSLRRIRDEAIGNKEKGRRRRRSTSANRAAPVVVSNVGAEPSWCEPIVIYDLCTPAERLVADYSLDGDLLDWIFARRACWRKGAFVTDIFLQLLDAIAYWHAKSVYHRDLKPENVLMSRDGRRAYLTNFAGSELVDEHRVGSTGYMSPESIDAMGAAHDVWALGIILALMLTGTHPWSHATPSNKLFRLYLLRPIGFFARTLPVSAQADAVLRASLCVDQRKRAGLSELRVMVEAVDEWWMSENELAREPTAVRAIAGQYAGKALSRLPSRGPSGPTGCSRELLDDGSSGGVTIATFAQPGYTDEDEDSDGSLESDNKSEGPITPQTFPTYPELEVPELPEEYGLGERGFVKTAARGFPW